MAPWLDFFFSFDIGSSIEALGIFQIQVEKGGQNACRPYGIPGLLVDSNGV